MKRLSPEQSRTLSLAQCHIFDAQSKLAYAVQLFGSLGFELVNDASHPIGGDLSDLVLIASSVLELLAGMTGATNALLVSASPPKPPQDYGATTADMEECAHCHNLFLPHWPYQRVCGTCILGLEDTLVDRDKDHGDTDDQLECTQCEFTDRVYDGLVAGKTCPDCGIGRLVSAGIPF